MYAYHKILIIDPGLVNYLFKMLFCAVFSSEIVFGGAYYWREFCVSKWVGLDNKDSLKNTRITAKNSLKHLTPTIHGHTTGRIIASIIWWACF